MTAHEPISEKPTAESQPAGIFAMEAMTDDQIQFLGQAISRAAHATSNLADPDHESPSRRRQLPEQWALESLEYEYDQAITELFERDKSPRRLAFFVRLCASGNGWDAMTAVELAPKLVLSYPTVVLDALHRMAKLGGSFAEWPNPAESIWLGDVGEQMDAKDKQWIAERGHDSWL